MRDYEELLKSLREHSKTRGCDCGICLCYDAESRGYATCSEELTAKAADAIEDMNRSIDALEADNESLCEQIDELSMKLHGDEAAIAGMKREIERMVVLGNKPHWIPVTERLPKIGDPVLCYCRANIYEVMSMQANGGWMGDGVMYMSGFVTHWMPLPKPPEEE